MSKLVAMPYVGQVFMLKGSARLKLWLVVCLLLNACGGGDDENTTLLPQPDPIGSGGINAPDKRHLPYVILVSFDGFRWDYQNQFATPAMDRLATAGVRAQALIPVFPTVTFPNHYSIATGLYPANHGIVANVFPSKDRQTLYDFRDPDTVGDGSWYGGEPVWVAAEKSGLVAGAFFFVGTEADIGGVRPTYWRTFDAGIPGDLRVDQVLEWLNLPVETRPHLITLYFGTADSTGHGFGPDSIENAVAVSSVDQYLGRLLDGIDTLPVSDQVYVVLVSDHGMSTYGSEFLILSDLVDLDGISIVGSGSYAFLFFEQSDSGRATQIRDTINGTWLHGQAWLPDDAPSEWHVSSESRFPDVIVQPNPGFTVVSDSNSLSGLPVGLHGWEPNFSDMHGIFLVSGPRLPSGLVIDAISVVDVYPLILEILDIPLTTPIDGNLTVLTRLLED